MNKHRMRWITVILFAALFLPACSMLSPSSAVPNQETVSAQAELTRQAQEPTRTPVSLPATFTPLPTETPIPTATLAPSSTPLPTSTPIPTFTPKPSATATETAMPSVTPGRVYGGGPGIPCYRAELMRDPAVLYGDVFYPSEEFTQSWRLKNTGACGWSTDFSLEFVTGDQMKGKAVALRKNVPPGEYINLPLKQVAPREEGTYIGSWMLQAPNGVRFGTGSDGRQALYVQIRVDRNIEGLAYDFIGSYCNAEWESAVEEELPCPGKAGDSAGFVIRLETPDQENRTENEPALWTNPDRSAEGYISGEYPAVEITAGDRFIADVGCLDDHDKCDVLFQVYYVIDEDDDEDEEDPIRLGSWHEVSDGQITRIDLDLTSLAGESVKFILVVDNNGNNQEDAAFWLVPHISHSED